MASASIVARNGVNEMLVQNPREFYREVYRQPFAVPAFNVCNLEMAKAVIEAAVLERAPVIVQITAAAVRRNPTLLSIQISDVTELRRLASLLTATPGVVALLGTGGELARVVFARSSDAGADMAVQLVDQALAKAHHLAGALALRVEVGAALAAAHREGRQRVFEDLLEAEELQDADIDAGVEADAALVRADGIVVLDTPAALDANIAIIVFPADAERHDAVGFGNAPQYLLRVIFFLVGDEIENIFRYFLNCLHELGLPPLRGLPMSVAMNAAHMMEIQSMFTRREPLLTRYTVAILTRTQTYDISAARTDLGYTPQVSVAEGIRRTLAALRS